MNYQGIIRNKVCKKLFEEINRRSFCLKCQLDRKDFEVKDKPHNNCYSNMLPGFSSKELSIPIDVLIIAESHGGGRTDTFRKQKDLKFEVNALLEYYLNKPLVRFHQKEMREILIFLNDRKKSWIFTDLIKCFVWQGKDNKSMLNGRLNRSKAILHCRKYLDKQIYTILPKKILSLGGLVTNQYFNFKGKLEHGSVQKYSLQGYKFEIIKSIFPSRNTSDLWIENNGWEKIKTKLV